MEKVYSVAIRPRLDSADRFYNHPDFQFHEIKLNHKGRYWIADPFLFEKDGQVYLFYEILNLITGVGKIAYSIMDEHGNATEPHIIIHERGHFSFPYIFENKGDIYIMPETCGRNTVQLYRAVRFPEKWEKAQVLIQNEFVVDSIFMNESNMDSILGSVQYRKPPEGRVISCWVKNVLFDRSGNTVKQQLIREGEYGIRNAGKIFLDKEGNHIRPGQDCSGGIYGKGLVFWQLDDNFTETEVYHVDAETMQSHIQYVDPKKIIGTHTYNASEHYEVIDFSYYSDISDYVQFMRRLYRYLLKIYAAIKKPIKRMIKGNND